ncbi:UPF0496 protein At3g19330 [Ricinus communis]|uniref:UPF0496 protein At3g19330 n=1 Tax=Ricinus communis TaxID=3988 RepID=UPI0007727BB5|nr:UPF0496 protein At3g19330 [Ricinus communis]XP_048234573.1 UPF0496 protein At3g19330 [Ricinus communis]XP_048234574.1 UPF0496 protein At3g19330 [Ricinus communis]|eukprot:XP_025012056.1 UPF0496 protein At3g19330 [Ricinus communis]
MLQCLSLKSPPAARSTSIPNSPPTIIDLNHDCEAGNSTDGTPVSCTLQSPVVNLTREYALYVQSNSFNEMRSRIHHQEIENGEQIESSLNIDVEDVRQFVLAQVLHPNRQCVEDALRHAKPNTLTRLVSNYFDHSESTTDLCLLLHRSVFRARDIYSPIRNLLEVLPVEMDSLTQSQCDYAYEIFMQFDRCDNPFPCPFSHEFEGIHRSFSELSQQLDHRLRKSRSKVHLVRRATLASALCFIGSAVAITLTALAITGHALVAIVACPFCAVTSLPSNLTKKELAHVKQLDAAARGTYVLNNELDTVDRLVALLYNSIENDKHLIRLGLGTGSDKYFISEVLKHLRKNHPTVIDQLKNLEKHICLYFIAVNRARNLLLQEIHVYQTSNS